MRAACRFRCSSSGGRSRRRCSSPPAAPISARPTGTGAFPRRVIAELGYAALFIGTLLEGETIVFLAGLAAHHGYLWFPAVVAVSVVGGSLSDQILFHVGRRYGARVYARFPGLAAKVPRVHALLRRWDVLALLLVRFAWGLRTVAPLVI